MKVSTMSEKRQIIVYGNGAMARAIVPMIQRDSRYKILLITADDEYVKNGTFLGLPQRPFSELTKDRLFRDCQALAIIGYSDIIARQEVFQRLQMMDVKFGNYVSAAAIVYDDLAIGCNNIICDNCYIGPGIRIGDNNLFRPMAYIGHDNEIGSGNYFAPNFTCTGGGKIGDVNFFGASSTVIEETSVSNGNIIGASSLVNRNIEVPGTYIGAPAKFFSGKTRAGSNST